MNTTNHEKSLKKDLEITANVRGEDLSQQDLLRIFAVGKTFTDVSFKQCNLQGCYFRNCRFIHCDFTGAFIKETNLRGAQFENCTFRYTTWEKTLLDESFLENCLPSEENLSRDLVRALRVNFAQIGNYEAVNRAASIEVKLTGSHLYNAAYSKQGYYRAKYKGLERVRFAFRHAGWKALDFLWGNGESFLRVFVWGLVTIVVVTGILWLGDPTPGFWGQAWAAVCIFWGVKPAHDVSQVVVVPSTVIRFFLFGLFMAILIKRLSRR